MRGQRMALSLMSVLALSLAACGEGESSSEGAEDPTAASGDTVCGATDASGDLLAQICEEGTLTVSTDPKYPPQSALDPETNEYEGFDIDVATEIATRLGVDIAWETPAWQAITSGSWNGRWDMSVGSMTPTNDRQKALHFTQPYYFTPAVALVHEDNTSISDVSTDLDGTTIGVCSGCTYEQFINGDLEIKGFTFDFVIDDAKAVGYDTDTDALNDLALGDGTRLDAAMTSLTTGQGFIDAGKPVKIVGDPVFYEPLAAAIDKNASPDPAAFVEAVDGIVGEMHSDGTLTKFSKKWYGGTDLTVQQ